MTITRRPYPSPNKFRPFVTNELIRRKSLPNIGDPEVAMPFGRFTSALQSKKADGTINYQFFSLGLSSIIESPNESMFELTHGSRDVVGYASNQTRARAPISVTDTARPNITIAGGANPAPGINQIMFNQYTSMSGIRCEVSWICYDESQLEFLRPHFLTPGVFVIIEFGQLFSQPNQKQLPFKVLDFTDPNITAKLADYAKNGRREIIQDFIEPSNGNYDIFVGQVANFNFKMESSNKYEITTIVYGVSEAIYGIPSADTTTTLVNGASTQEKTNLHEFFARTTQSQFNRIIFNHIGEQKNVFRPHNDDTFVEDPSDGTAAERALRDAERLPKIMQNNNIYNEVFDNIYISFPMFVNTVLNGPLGVYSILNGWGIHLTPIKNFESPLAQEPDLNIDETEPVIGNHPHLYTLDPERMILVKSAPLQEPSSETFLKKIRFNLTFEGHPLPDAVHPSDSNSGRLSNGVWINTSYISDCFLSTDTFMDGLQKLLDGLSDATGNYWRLALYYNDEYGAFQIVDSKYFPFPEAPAAAPQPSTDKYYLFNEGIKGELLGLSLNSNLSQMQSSQAAIMVGSGMDQTAGIGEGSQATRIMSEIALDNMIDLVRASLPAVAPGGQQVFNATTDIRTSTAMVPANGAITPNPASGVPDGQATLASPLESSNVHVSSLYGNRVRNNLNNQLVQEFHNGLDFRSPAGSLVKATGNGTIMSAADLQNIQVETKHIDGTSTYGPPHGDDNTQYVGVRHDDGVTLTIYRHITLGGAIVSGVHVRSGDVLGVIAVHADGDPNSTGPHLHLEVYGLTGIDGRYRAKNPLDVLQPDVVHLSPTQLQSRINQSHNQAAFVSDVKPEGYEPPAVQSERDARAQLQIEKNARANELRRTYGITNDVLCYVMLSRSDLLNQIHQSIRSDFNSRHTNAFFAPIPTQTQLSIILPGLSGFSISDAYYVDKIPRAFKRAGIFLLTSYNHIINPRAWRTQLNGTFFFTGEGFTL